MAVDEFPCNCNVDVTKPRFNTEPEADISRRLAMRDLIRSPLQFVRLMTEQEWEAMRLRATAREVRRERRQRAKKEFARVA
jgi:hypothetical protein